MNRVVKVAAIQSNPKIFNKQKNLEKCIESIKQSSNEGAELIVFPECSLTGYCFSNLEEAFQTAETIPGPSINQIASLCKNLQIFVVVYDVTGDIHE